MKRQRRGGLKGTRGTKTEDDERMKEKEGRGEKSDLWRAKSEGDKDRK